MKRTSRRILAIAMVAGMVLGTGAGLAAKKEGRTRPPAGQARAALGRMAGELKIIFTGGDGPLQKLVAGNEGVCWRPE